MRLPLITVLGLLALAGGDAASEAATPKPLKLHPRELGEATDLARGFKGRYAARLTGSGRISLLDDVAGRRYAQPVPGGCFVQDVRLPEALLDCPDPEGEFSRKRRPVIVNLRDGGQAALTRGEREAPSPRKVGYAPGSYFRLGSHWIEGIYEGCDIAHNPRAYVYVNRFSGERRESCFPQRLDLDSADLTPDYPPQACRGFGRELLDPSARRWLSGGRRAPSHLVLRRCGKRARLISRCPDQCYNGTLTRRFVIWSGNKTVTIHEIRTGRRFKLRFPGYDRSTTGYLIGVAATDRRAWISLARPVSPVARFRIIEVRLPLR